jgi:4-diphosphocytidyl-2-C-methyl-D-erythritol kinase
MLVFPCAKINLGLNVVEKRPDGYHNLETVFYPIPLTDALEVTPMDDKYPLESGYDLKMNGPEAMECRDEDNLVSKAFRKIAEKYGVPRLHIHLYKGIPSQAGLGGGSSDAAYMIRLLDKYCNLNMGNREMERHAAKLGADCAFFITAEPAYATGIGDELKPIASNRECKNYLKGYWLALVKPPVAVSTKEAYSNIKPRKPKKCCREIVLQPIETWKDELVNDFEEGVFSLHLELADIKQDLYDKGAVYACMSGSGSSIFGIFKEKPEGISEMFADSKTYVMEL